MKVLTILVVFITQAALAGEITLSRHQEYVVPDQTIWVVKKVHRTDCRVCTSDVYLSGEASNVEVSGIMLHGKSEFSFTIEFPEVKFHSGTKFYLGDTMEKMVIEEMQN